MLVASAESGSRPADSSAGTLISPPPPAMESMKPAASPTSPSMRTVDSGVLPKRSAKKASKIDNPG